MARDSRSPRSASTGPGRTPRRNRASGRASSPGSASEPRERLESTAPRLRWGVRLTRRALVMVVVIAALAISFGGSLRIYLSQQHDLAVAEQQIRESSAEIAELQSQLARWDDPDYVKAQARERLGWVMPGEIGYRVVGPDGKPIGGGVVIDSAKRLPAGEHDPVWWDRLWGSVQTADSPTRKVTVP